MTDYVDTYLDALRAADEIMVHPHVMCRCPENIPVSIDDLVAVVGEVKKVWITLEDVSFEATYVKGKLERFRDNRANIYVKRDLDMAEKRRVIVKELSHLIMDGADAQSPKGVETIKSLVNPYDDFEKEGNSNPVKMSETMADWIAEEILYPYEYRRSDYESLEAGEHTETSLAMRYHIPRHMVGGVLTPNWLDLMDDLWSRVRAQAQ